MTLRRLFLLFGLMTLASCGFEPMYGTATQAQHARPVDVTLSKIYIDTIPDRDGVFLRNALMDRFYRRGAPDRPYYTLVVDPLTERKADFDVTRESETTRAQLTLSTRVRLVGRETGKTVLTRSVKSITSYNVLESQFTTRVSEQDAREAALKDLARQIELELGLYFNR